jgi:hypothetical protein
MHAGMVPAPGENFRVAIPQADDLDRRAKLSSVGALEADETQRLIHEPARVREMHFVRKARLTDIEIAPGFIPEAICVVLDGIRAHAADSVQRLEQEPWGLEREIHADSAPIQRLRWLPKGI